MAGVEVHEGQKLSWTIEPLSEGGDAGTFNPADLTVMMHNPLREPVDGPDGATFGRVQLRLTTPQGSGMTAPVQLANRESEDASVQTTWLGGLHYLQIEHSTLKTTDDGTDEPARYLLTLQVDGEAGTDPQLVTSTDAPENATVDDQGHVTAAPDAGGSDDGASAAQDGGASAGRSLLITGAVVAAAVAIAAAAGAIRLLRRRP